jgi:oligopeptide transport system permease protein
MGRYTLRRLIQLVFVFFGVTLIIYAAVWALPGDPIRALSGDRPMSESTINALREQFHLNDPFYVQYLTYIGNLLRGDLGTDFSGRSVAQQMGSRWPVTINLALTALLFEAVFGVVLGIIAATRGKITDHVILLFSISIISLPVFVLAYIAQILLGVKAGIFPVSGISAGWISYVLPGFILGAAGTASVSRLVRSSMLENLRADYARTAHAKGLSNLRVLTHHVLRNSLVPAVTFLGIELGYLMGGAIVIEGVFNLPGIGQLLFRATAGKEGAVVVGVASMLVLIFLLMNLLVDLLYGVLDPRIRYE